MDLDSIERQITNGYFELDEKPQRKENRFEGEVFLNRFNLRESYVKFHCHVPKPSGGDTICFVDEGGLKLYLRFPTSYWSGNYFEEKFSIEKVVHPISDKNYIRTGSIKRLIYFPDEIEVFGFTVRKCERQYYEGEKRKRENYFEWSYQKSITDREIEKILMALSFLTSSSLFISEHSNGETTIIFNMKSSKFTIPYMGSGMMFFPITVETVEGLIEKIKWKHIYNFHLAYKHFCRAKNLEYQLYKGCSILDYMISLFDRNLDLRDFKQRLKHSDKSSVLYSLLWYLNLDISTKSYLEKIFPETSWSEFKLDKRFEFFELRDSHIHRGQLFLNQEEVSKFQRCLVAVNELIRILIPHLDKIDEWGFTNKPFYNTASSSKIVSARQDLIKWKI